MSLIERICAQYGIQQEQLVKHDEEGDEITFLIDYGSAGTKHYRVPAAAVPELEPEPEPEQDGYLYGCATCGRSFETEWGLSVHQRSHVVGDEEE